MIEEVNYRTNEVMKKNCFTSELNAYFFITTPYLEGNVWEPPFRATRKSEFVNFRNYRRCLTQLLLDEA